jgi:hypothetical protein
MKTINKLSIMKTINKLSIMKTINKLSIIKSINNLSLVKTIIEHVMRTRVLRRSIVFLRVRCSIYFRCSIPILLIKNVRFSIRSL